MTQFYARNERGTNHAAAKEWLLAGGLGDISDLRAETVHGDSRFDFSFVLDGVKILAMDCAVTESGMDLRLPVLVKL